MEENSTDVMAAILAMLDVVDPLARSEIGALMKDDHKEHDPSTSEPR
jgi:hypothetical protein